ncbi:hypothetical protein [Roseibium algicola]|uniref:hypothetical protein n=1 Tax=Roseibium algicola TaxID=2857014 RepID=UPI0012EBF92D|nr:hypothetical protein [Roseibium aggregatum]
MKYGKVYVSTGFKQKSSGGFWHLLFALHRRWRLAFVRPDGKPEYRRLYVGPLEIEWSN